mgnify:FL=1
MSQEQNDDQKNDKENGRVAIPRSLDPGWATVLAAGVALIGTLAVLIFGRSGPDSPSPTATIEPTSAVSQVIASDTPAATKTEPPPTPPPATPPEVPQTSTLEATDTPTPTETVEPDPVPSITLLDGLSPAQKESILGIWDGVKETAFSASLIMRDTFDVNDYDWDEWSEIGMQGVSCDVSVRDSGFRTVVQTTIDSGPGHYCLSFAPRGVGTNFVLSFDATLAHDRNAEILFYYRYIDDLNFYYIILNPQTQMLTVGVLRNGVNVPFLERYTPEINKTGTNAITFLGLDKGHNLYINDDFIVSITYPVDTLAGNVMLGLKLNESNETEELIIDNLELRGDL